MFIKVNLSTEQSSSVNDGELKSKLEKSIRIFQIIQLNEGREIGGQEEKGDGWQGGREVVGERVGNQGAEGQGGAGVRGTCVRGYKGIGVQGY